MLEPGTALYVVAILTLANVIIFVATIWISNNTIISQTQILSMTSNTLQEQQRFLQLLDERHGASRPAPFTTQPKTN